MKDSLKDIGRKPGPIGMSEEKDTAQLAREQAEAASENGEDMQGVVPQMEPSAGLPERAGERRRKDRVMQMLHTLPQPGPRKASCSR